MRYTWVEFTSHMTLNLKEVTSTRPTISIVNTHFRWKWEVISIQFSRISWNRIDVLFLSGSHLVILEETGFTSLLGVAKLYSGATEVMTPASVYFLWEKGSWLLWPTVHEDGGKVQITPKARLFLFVCILRLWNVRVFRIMFIACIWYWNKAVKEICCGFLFTGTQITRLCEATEWGGEVLKRLKINLRIKQIK